MKICSRFIRHLIMALVLLSSAALAHAVQVTATWTGAGDGTTYTDAANWSPAVVPRNGTPAGTTYRVVVDGNNAQIANVNFNTSVTIDALVVTQGDSFNINAGRTLTVINSGAGTGTIANSGTIRINASVSGVANLLINGDVTLSGGGTLTMNDTNPSVNSNNATIFGSAGTNRLTNVDNTISGAGSFGGGQMVFTNRGTIIATNPNKLLVINPTIRSTDNINSGTMRADGGTLNFQLHTINNDGGTIEALDGSVVELRSPTFNGGTLQTTGTGLFRTTDLNGLPTFANLTTKGNVQIPSSSSLTLVGNIVNSGTIAINETGDGAASLRIIGNVNLSGGGTVTLADKAGSGSLLSSIFGTAATDRLTNADNIISGAGAIGNGQMLFTNRSTVIAQGANPLVISTTRGSTDNFNTGTLRGEGAGGMVIFLTNLTNTSGTIEARAGSVADLSASTVTGGTLATVGTGIVQSGGFRGQTNATLNNVTNTGNIKVVPSTSIILAGVMTNRGTIRLASSDGGTTGLRIAGEVTLSGGGTVTLDDADGSGSLFSFIVGNTGNGTDRLTNADNTISGAGSLEGVPLINNGTILPRGTNPLLFLSPVTNNNIIRVDAGNTLRINTGLTLTQAAGLLLVNGTFDSIINGPGNVNVTGGTLAGAGAITNNVNNSGGLVSPGNITATNESGVGTLTLGANYTQGANGKLLTQIGGPELTSFDRLAVSGSAIFAGTLDVQLLGSYAPASTDQFRIVNYASRTGTGTMTLNVVGRDNRGGFTQKYNPTNLTLTAQGVPTIGVNIQPTQVFTNTVLTATVITAPETPVNSVTYDFRVNGVSKQKGSSNIYDLGVAGQGDKNDVITVVAQTDDDRSNQNRVTIQNTKPVAQGSANNNARGGELISIPLTGTDLDGDALTFRIVTGARNGVAAIRAVGSGFVLDYTGRGAFNGSEAIQFVANDGQGNSAPATINIAVNSPIPPVVNRAPIAFSRVVTVDAEQATDIPLDAADPDPADTLDTLGFLIVRDATKGIRQNFFLRDGRVFFRYLPNAGASGADSFQFVAVDKAGNGLTSNVATISIAINRAAVNRVPVASSNGGFVANAGEAIDVRLDVTDPEDKLETLVFKTVKFPTQGTLQTIFLRDQRVFIRYLPNADARGTDSFSFTATDPGGLTSNVATIAIAINARNVTPSADNASATVESSQSIDIPVTATSPVGSALTFNVVNNPTKGNGSFVNIGGRTVYRYRSVVRYNGPDSINFRVTDAQGRTSNTATISIRVNYTAPNRPPVAFSGTATVTADQIIDIPFNVIDPDPEDIKRTLTLGIIQPTKGSILDILDRDGQSFFRYRANLNASGTDSIQFFATDKGGNGLTSNTATISIAIIPRQANRAPVAFSSSRQQVVGQAIDITVSAIDPDDGDTIDTLFFRVTEQPRGGTITGVSLVNGNVIFRYVPRAGFQGSQSFSFTVTDSGGLTSNVATITIVLRLTQTNRAPVAFDVSGNVRNGFNGPEAGIILRGSDPDSNPLTYTLVSSPTQGSGRIEGPIGTVPIFRYSGSPNSNGNSNFIGIDRATFIVTDSSGRRSNVATITINGFPRAQSATQFAPDESKGGEKTPSGGSS